MELVLGTLGLAALVFVLLGLVTAAVAEGL